ncbi:MAG TPA: hypothetical protein VM166_10775 [Gemmatimonadaceae bacterium]|nr:hypothetical protein [Gemmatimonadaceae bacterium]
MTHMRVLLAVILLVVPVFAGAQFPDAVQRGTRVRVWIPEPARQKESPPRRQLIRGTVESVEADMLRLRVPGTVGSFGIPRTSVRRLDVSSGVSRGASMFDGAAGGAIGGAVTFALMNDPRRRGGPHYARDWRAAGVGATWGAGIGAVVGFIWPHERWRRVIR